MTNNKLSKCAKCREMEELAESGDSEALTYKPNMIYAESDFILLVDVSKAYEIAKAHGNLPTFANEPNELALLISDNEICEEHIYHVNCSEPGLVITFSFYNRETHQREAVNVLADGNHRAARALLEGRRFYFYYLDANDTKSVIEAWQ